MGFEPGSSDSGVHILVHDHKMIPNGTGAINASNHLHCLLGTVNINSEFQTVPCTWRIPKNPSGTTFLTGVGYTLWREWDKHFWMEKGTILFNPHLSAYILGDCVNSHLKKKSSKVKTSMWKTLACLKLHKQNPLA